ncbi:Uncharacterised protein [Mycobacterium tuberculosis]|nr:Uncharacterised protein [Mycobacterium tuberculosis]
MIFKPNDGKPKKMKNNCTRNGVLRINSTYTPKNQANGWTFHARTTAPTVPSATPRIAPMAVSSRVNSAPRSSRSVLASTGTKSN